MHFFNISLLIVLKRMVDIFGALVALLLFSPFLFCATVAIALNMGHPVFFRQVRPGLNGKPFKMIKFRTMREATGGEGKLLSDAERMTPFGRFMREYQP